MGSAAAFPAHHGLQVIDVLDDPDEGFGLHEVEWDVAGDGLALGNDPLGDIPDDHGLDHAGVGAVQVDVPGGKAEVVLG